MTFKVLYYNYETSYIVELEDGTTALVNLTYKEKMTGDISLLCKFGMWDAPGEPVSEEILKQIEEILKS